MPLLLLPLSFVVGYLDAGLAKDPVLNELLLSVYVMVSIGILFRWVQLDAAKRKARVSWLLRLMLLALTIFALPYYFFRSRGTAGGAKLLGLAGVIFAGAMLCYRLGYAL